METVPPEQLVRGHKPLPPQEDPSPQGWKTFSKFSRILKIKTAIEANDTFDLTDSSENVHMVKHVENHSIFDELRIDINNGWCGFFFLFSLF